MKKVMNTIEKVVYNNGVFDRVNEEISLNEVSKRANELLGFSYRVNFIIEKVLEPKSKHYNLIKLDAEDANDFEGCINPKSVKDIHLIDSEDSNGNREFFYIVNGLCGIIAVIFMYDDVVYMVKRKIKNKKNEDFITAIEAKLKSKYKEITIDSELEDETREDA